MNGKQPERMKMPEPKRGDLCVWHIPQLPMKPFLVPVSSPEEGNKVLNILAEYDLFQLERHIKPDYCNAQGLNQYFVYSEKDKANGLETGWETWYSDEGEELDEYMERVESAAIDASNQHAALGGTTEQLPEKGSVQHDSKSES